VHGVHVDVELDKLPDLLPPPLGEGRGGGIAWHRCFLTRAPLPSPLPKGTIVQNKQANYATHASMGTENRSASA
jgi:hypothetical protein